MSRARAVLFDLDGTLHDRDAGVRSFLAAQHAELRLDAYGVTLERWAGRFASIERRGRVWKDVVYVRLVGEFALPHSPEALLEDYVSGFARHTVPHDGAHDVLAALRESGWRTGLVTNGRSAFQRSTVAALGIAPFLDTVVVSGECGLRKPQREIFELALKEVGCDAEGSWFVGDDPVADVEGARKAGMRAVLFRNGTIHAKGMGEIASLGDVPSLVGLP